MHRDGTVPSRKKHRDGTVPSRKKHRDGTVPSRKKHRDGTVENPTGNFHMTHIIQNSLQDKYIMYVCSTTLKKSVLVVQGQLFVQSPLRVKSAKAKGKKANCTKKLAKEKHMQTAQITSPEI